MLKGIFGVLIGLLLVLSIMFGKLVIGSDLKKEEKVLLENPKHHLQIIVQNTDEDFWTSFQEGVKAAEEEYGVYAELVTVSQRNIDDLREAVEMGVNAGVDGIALQAVDTVQTPVIIEGAKEQGIAIVTYENGNFVIPPSTPTVGTNSYSLGCIAGDMAIEASDGVADVAVIINNAGNQSEPKIQNLIVQGILDSFQIYSTIDINKVYTINADLFEAEKLASSIIEDTNKVDIIICFDERSTPAIAQILVDNNMVGDIKLIGYGIMPQTLDYIERHVIYSTICPNAYEIGYSAVRQLTQSLNGEQISDYISTELFTIDAENVKQYSQQIEQD